MVTPFDAYLRKLREIPLSEHTEHTDRSALETLLNHFASETGQRITVQHEPKREPDKGAPDFKITRQGMILGYVEAKEIGANLDKVLKSDQIKRYRTLSDNIIVTDYLQWIWIDRERVKGREILAYQTDLEGRTLRVVPERAEAVAKLIAAFFSTAPEGIGRAQQLALELATRSKLLRDYLGEELIRQEREHKEGRLYGLFQVFRDQIFHELTLKEFADAFAQMLAYGLFLARINSDSEPVTLNNARQYVPGSFRLIRELVEFVAELGKDEYRDVRWVVEEILSIVNSLDLPAIHEDLSFRRRKAISRKVRASDEEEHRRSSFKTRLGACAGASLTRIPATGPGCLSRQGGSHSRGGALFAGRASNLDQQDSVFPAGAAERLGFSYRRLSGARQISEFAQGPRAISRRNQSCRRGSRQPRLHHRSDGRDR
ncbi:MAG: hypothetical protein WBC64_03175 [Methylovirgula sp.]